MQYKAHIDGLRAIAVVSVVLFHLDVGIISGGFVGVDIFFVISGYLISGILYDDIEKRRYSLLEFYKKRILRILPALSVVLLATLAVSTLIFFPIEQIAVGKSVIAAALFVSNFYFWIQSDYFAPAAEVQPLLHTWSLAVEEQFYIFFPPVLFLLMKFSRRYLLHWSVALSIVSLASCVYLTRDHWTFAFFMLPPRAWELGIGVCLSIWTRQSGKSDSGNDLTAMAGLALMVAPVFLLDAESSFPGFNAFYPVVGTALLIGWAERTLVGGVLSTKPFVWIGKISYSLYLWHWPIIVFWKTVKGHHINFGITEIVIIFALSVSLAAISTHFIEQPFRTKKARLIPAGTVVTTGLAVLVLFAGLGLLHQSDRFTLRPIPDRIAAIAATAGYADTAERRAQFQSGKCFITSVENSFAAYDKARCTSVDPDRANALLIGDSHAAQYAGAIEAVWPGVNLMQATASGCRPLLDVGGAKRCTDMRDWIFGKFLPENPVDTVFVGGRWHPAELERGLMPEGAESYAKE